MCCVPDHLGRIPSGRARCRFHPRGPKQACHDSHVSPSLLIVDDHEDFRRSARALLEAEGFTVVGEAEHGNGRDSQIEG